MRRTVVGLVAVVALLVGGCSSGGSEDTGAGEGDDTTTRAAPASTTSEPAPEPMEDQTPPASINGITVQGDTIWIASIESDEVLQVDRASGAILQRFATDGAGPDDVAVAPDGSVWSTGFANGDVGVVEDGVYDVALTLDTGPINPLEFDDGGVLFVGTYGPDGTLYRIEGDPREGDVEAKKIADGTLPDINAFGILDDGTLVAPAGGIGGPGSAISIDPETGVIETIVDGLPGVAAGTTDADGNPFLLANATGDVIAIDVEAGTSEVVQTVEQGAPFDNLAFADDGTLYLSSFVAPTITEVAPDGTERLITIGE